MKVEIWSDVVCPWCAIGKANLDGALAQFEHAGEVEVVWRSFELDPGAPAVRDGDYVQMLARKYGTGAEGGRAMVQKMTRAGASVGVEMRFDIAQPGNSFDAHRLVHLARERGIQMQVKERFLRGYLSEGAAVGEHEALVALAVDAGLAEDEVRAVLGSDSYADAVRADAAEGLRLGITGVPMMLVDGRFAIPGAQPPEVILQTLRRAWDESRPVVVGTGTEGVCGPDGCAV